MKSPKMKFVVVSAIALASVVGIFVSAESPAPDMTSKETGKDLRFHIVMTCADVKKGKLVAALSSRPSDTYRFEFDHDSPIGRLPTGTPPLCPSAHLNGNSTQKAAFANTKELRAFLDAAGL